MELFSKLVSRTIKYTFAKCILTFFALLTLENNCMNHVIEMFYKKFYNVIIIEYSFITVIQ